MVNWLVLVAAEGISMALSLLALPLIGKAKEQAKVMSAFFRVNFIGKFLIFNLIMRVITLPVKRYFCY
jgi:hypothetical protein